MTSSAPAARLSQRETWKNRLAALRDLPELWRLLWAAAPLGVAGTIGLRVLGGLSPLAMLYAAKQIIDMLAAAAAGKGVDVTSLWTWVGIEFALAAVSQAIGRGVDYLDGLITDRFSHSMALRIMHQAATLDLARFEDPAFQDRLERARAQSSDRIRTLTSAGWLIQRMVMLISLAGGIIYFSPWLMLVLILCVTPAFLVESHFAFLGYSLAQRLTPARRSLDYHLSLGSSPQTAKEIKVFALDQFLESRYSEVSEDVIRQTRRLATRRLSWSTVFALLAAVGYYGSYAFLAHEALMQRISLGTFSFLAGAIAGANGHLQAIFSLFSEIADQALYLRDLVLFLRETPSMPRAANPIPPPRPMRVGIEFENVSFHYPGSDHLVLNNMSFQLEKGQRVALVGENGEGKTTLVKLLTRLYDPSHGRILLDNVDLREYDLDALRKEIGVIFQDFVRYDMPARENIAVGDIRKLEDDRALWSSTKKSNSFDLVDNLPKRLEQMLGRRFEGGVDLSGGEWQRLALARSYLRRAQILILDEPTAALDPMAEFEVFRNFAQLTDHKTAIFISHRFSTVRMADRIIVLSKGKIIEDGAHDNLVTTGGLYSTLFEMQALSYR